MQSTTDEEPIEVGELARQVKVSPSTLYRAIRAGSLIALRIGNGRGTLRVHRSDWDAYLDACRAAATP